MLLGHRFPRPEINVAASGVFLSDLRDTVFRDGLGGVAGFESEFIAVVEPSFGQGKAQDAGDECAQDRGQ